MVFQQFNLFPHMTVMDNITLAPIKLKGLSRKKPGKAVTLLRKVGLADKDYEYPNKLSGGQNSVLP